MASIIGIRRKLTPHITPGDVVLVSELLRTEFSTSISWEEFSAGGYSGYHARNRIMFFLASGVDLHQISYLYDKQERMRELDSNFGDSPKKNLLTSPRSPSSTNSVSHHSPSLISSPRTQRVSSVRRRLLSSPRSPIAANPVLSQNNRTPSRKSLSMKDVEATNDQLSKTVSIIEPSSPPPKLTKIITRSSDDDTTASSFSQQEQDVSPPVLAKAKRERSTSPQVTREIKKTSSLQEDVKPKKRGRGRPRKSTTTNSSGSSSPTTSRKLPVGSTSRGGVFAVERSAMSPYMNQFENENSTQQIDRLAATPSPSRVNEADSLEETATASEHMNDATTPSMTEPSTNSNLLETPKPSDNIDATPVSFQTPTAPSEGPAEIQSPGANQAGLQMLQLSHNQEQIRLLTIMTARMLRHVPTVIAAGRDRLLHMLGRDGYSRLLVAVRGICTALGRSVDSGDIGIMLMDTMEVLNREETQRVIEEIGVVSNNELAHACCHTLDLCEHFTKRIQEMVQKQYHELTAISMLQ